jgi:hypothetical protein
MILGAFMVSLLFVPVAYAQVNSTETLTITTYYPSPTGVYRDLTVKRSIKYAPLVNPPDSADSTQGQLVYVNNTTSGVNGFYYYDGSAWQAQASGGGGVCYTSYGDNICYAGYTKVVDGYANLYGSYGGSSELVCGKKTHAVASGIAGARPYVSSKGSTTVNYGDWLDSEPCAICCK